MSQAATKLIRCSRNAAGLRRRNDALRAKRARVTPDGDVDLGVRGLSEHWREVLTANAFGPKLTDVSTRPMWARGHDKWRLGWPSRSVGSNLGVPRCYRQPVHKRWGIPSHATCGRSLLRSAVIVGTCAALLGPRGDRAIATTPPGQPWLCDVTTNSCIIAKLEHGIPTMEAQRSRALGITFSVTSTRCVADFEGPVSLSSTYTCVLDVSYQGADDKVLVTIGLYRCRNPTGVEDYGLYGHPRRGFCNAYPNDPTDGGASTDSPFRARHASHSGSPRRGSHG